MGRQVIRRVGGSSLAGQARDAILQAISANRFEGGRLPPEAELALLLGVSRTTVRAALQSLEWDGFINRSPGRGTTILRHTNASLGLHRLAGFSNLLKEIGYEPSVEVEMEQSDEPSKDAVEKLGIKSDEACLIAKKLFRADQDPAIWLYDVYPLTRLRRMPGKNDISDSIFTFSETHFHEPIDHAVVEIVPSVTDDEISKRLQIKKDSPYLYLKETHYSSRGDPLAFSGLCVNDAYVRFHVFRRTY